MQVASPKMKAPGFAGSMLVLESDVVSAKQKLSHVTGSSLGEVEDDVRRRLGLSFPIKLLVHDADFNEFMRVENLTELSTKTKVKVERAKPAAAPAPVGEGDSGQQGVMRLHGGGAQKDFVAPPVSAGLSRPYAPASRQRRVMSPL